jgi:hypothetical protein
MTLYNAPIDGQAPSGGPTPRPLSTGATTRTPPAAPAAPHPASNADKGRRPRKGNCGNAGSTRGGPSGRGGSQAWPSFYNPWIGTIVMCSGQAPSASRPPVSTLLIVPPYDVPPLTPPQLTPLGTSTPTPWSPLARGWHPAALVAAFSTMAMTPPSSDWVVDSGASYHTTSNTGTLSHPHPSHPSSIVVGNGSTLSVTSVGASVLPEPFYLNNVLVAPHFTHNLLYVCRFTTDNSCSIEFDPFGFSVKDLATRTPLARCDSLGPLYTLQPSSTCASSPPVLVSTTSSTTWHCRLVHPGPDVMNKLTSSLDLLCST